MRQLISADNSPFPFALNCIVGTALMAGVVMQMSAQTASASWAYVPQEVRMAEADLIVAGTVEKLAVDVTKDGTVYEVGVIKPSKILKGKPNAAGIRLAWPKRVAGGLRLSTDLPAPKVGESSIWVMQADAKLPIYWATYPTDRQPIDKLDEMQAKMKVVNNLPWSQPTEGLQVGVFVEQQDMRKSNIRVNGKPVKALARMSAYTLFKNAGDTAMHVVHYPYDDPFSIALIGPDGQAIEVQTAINSPRKPEIKTHNFVELAPSQMKPIGYGFQLGMATKPGQYTITLRYKNDHEGKQFGFDNVWTGQVTTPTIQFKVAK